MGQGLVEAAVGQGLQYSWVLLRSGKENIQLLCQCSITHRCSVVGLVVVNLEIYV